MYQKFFGFKERPFKLVPNPAYLFLSRSHEEALAHLSYAISQGDGFVEITGEVGTGKTTLCRAFLETLDENTEAAYIFNPKLDAVQLLKAINDEFGIRSKPDNIKDLIDILNAFLIEKKGQGKGVILLVDEAQNLTVEVLEQLRLLSNLETTTSKLLQIILVGQPELADMLDSYDLRQLGQRITLSCHIHPMTRKETRLYILHRIHTASQKQGVAFTRAAFYAIYRYSRGIPRQINILCDRALLFAYGLNKHTITGGIVKASERELAGRGGRKFGLQGVRKSTLALAVLCVAMFLYILFRPDGFRLSGSYKNVKNQEAGAVQKEKINPAPITPQAPAPAAPSPAESAPLERKEIPPREAPMPEVADPISPPEPEKQAAAENVNEDLTAYVKRLETRTSRRAAFLSALKLWKKDTEIGAYLDNLEDDSAFFQFAAKQNGLMVQRVKGDLDLVKKLNLPAIFEFYSPDGMSPRYLTLCKIHNGKLAFKADGAGDDIISNPDALQPLWSGVVYIPWQNFLDYSGIIPLSAPRESIIALKMLLHDLGFQHIDINPVYDEDTREVVKKIQIRHGIVADGIVGPITKMVLYNEKKSLNIPHIYEEAAGSQEATSKGDTPDSGANLEQKLETGNLKLDKEKIPD